MVRTINFQLSADQIASCTVVVGDPPVTKFYQKSGMAKITGKSAYSDILVQKVSELIPQFPKLHVRDGFKKVGADRMRLYMKCEHSKTAKDPANTITYTTNDLRQGEALDLVLDVKCVACCALFNAPAPPAEQQLLIVEEIQAAPAEKAPTDPIVPTIAIHPPHSATDLLNKASRRFTQLMVQIDQNCAEDGGMSHLVRNRDRIIKAFTDMWSETVDPECAAFREANPQLFLDAAALEDPELLDQNQNPDQLEPSQADQAREQQQAPAEVPLNNNAGGASNSGASTSSSGSEPHVLNAFDVLKNPQKKMSIQALKRLTEQKEAMFKAKRQKLE